MEPKLPSAFAVPTLIHGSCLVQAASAEPAPLLVGFHGYGENASRHLQHLGEIPGVGSWRRAGVEALHRFYNQKTGEVLGSWMTKEGREQAIEDNIRYAGSALAELRRQQEPTCLVLAGFSQGVAMTYRAAARAGHRCDGLIVLAGDVPPDLGPSALEALPPVLLGRGHKDSWYTEAKMEQDLQTLEGAGVSVQPVVFRGGHSWESAFLTACGDFLASTLAKHS